MSGFKLKDSIFNTTTNNDEGWDFSGIVKDNVATNTSKNDIVDINKSNAPKQTETGGDSLLGGIFNMFGDNSSKTSGDNSGEINNDGMFSGKNIGSTLKGGGAIVGALSSIYGTLEQNKFNKEVLGMEKDRINRNIAREDKLQKNYQGVWS